MKPRSLQEVDDCFKNESNAVVGVFLQRLNKLHLPSAFNNLVPSFKTIENTLKKSDSHKQRKNYQHQILFYMYQLLKQAISAALDAGADIMDVYNHHDFQVQQTATIHHLPSRTSEPITQLNRHSKKPTFPSLAKKEATLHIQNAKHGRAFG